MLRNVLFVALFLGLVGYSQPLLAQTSPSGTVACVNIYHDEVASNEQRGPINAIMLANLLGHWPEYEIRVRPIGDYSETALAECKATFFLATTDDAEIPDAFLEGYFSTDKPIAWIGFSLDQLDQDKFEEAFAHRVSGVVDIDEDSKDGPSFYQFVSYKGSLFRKQSYETEDRTDGAFRSVRFFPTDDRARDMVLAELIHNKSYYSNPYFLRSGNKFVVGDVPFSYMHEAGRYFAFADLVFDILGEKPVRDNHLAFARIEDIHGNYDIGLLRAVVSDLRSEQVPVSIAHIPLFMDPNNRYGAGAFKEPQPANSVASFEQFVSGLAKDDENVLIMHGVTHQYGLEKNPHTGTSGDDYEFWDMVNNKPVANASVETTLDRLSMALPVFEKYGRAVRYWVTPHYSASAMDNRVFSDVFPWQVGRVTYYPSSYGPSFVLPSVSRSASLSMSDVTAARLNELKQNKPTNIDMKSEEPLTQMFPYEIYRDVYGQRIVPETLNYLSYETSEQTEFVRTVDDMLADARRNKVVRDYWASFFFHPYIFENKEDGGIGKFKGDTFELRKLLIGLKLLDYEFTSLPKFEKSLQSQPGRQAAGEASKNPVAN